MKKFLLIILAIFVLIFIGILIIEQRTNLLTSFINPQYDSLDINQDGVVDQKDISQYTDYYEENDIRADFDRNGKVDFEDISQYVFLYRNK